MSHFDGTSGRIRSSALWHDYCYADIKPLLLVAPMIRRPMLACLVALLAALCACGPEGDCGTLASGPVWTAYAFSSEGGTQVELRWQNTDATLRLVRTRVLDDGAYGEDKRFGKVSGTSFVDSTVTPDTHYYYRLTSITDPEDGSEVFCAVTVWAQHVYTASAAAWSGNGFSEVHPLSVGGELFLFDRGEYVSLTSAYAGSLRWMVDWLDHDWLLDATGAPVYVPERNAIAMLDFRGEQEQALFFLDAESGETIGETTRAFPSAIAPIAFDAGNGKTTLALIEAPNEFDKASVFLLANDGAELWSEKLYLGVPLQPATRYEWGKLASPPLVLPASRGDRILLAGRRSLDQGELPFVSPIDAGGKADWTVSGYFTSFVASGDELYAVNDTGVTVIDVNFGTALRAARYLPFRVPRAVQAQLSGEAGGARSLVITEAPWPKFADPFSTAVVDPSTLVTRWAAFIGRVLGVGDADGDGVDDVISLADDGTSVGAYNGMTGSQLWRFHLTGRADNLSAQEIKVLRLGTPVRPWLAVIERALYATTARITILGGNGDEAVAFDVPINDVYRFSWRESSDPQVRISALPPDRILFQIERAVYVVQVP